MRNMRFFITMIFVGFAVLAICPTAWATFPGENGEIAFATRSGIHAIQADGSGDHLLHLGSYAPEQFDYSSDGTMAVVVDATDDGDVIQSVDLATKHVTDIVIEQWQIFSVAYSPDGGSVAFCVQWWGKQGFQLYTVDVGGSDLAEVPGTWGSCRVDWSADDRLVASKVFPIHGKRSVSVMAPDGSDPLVIATMPPARDSMGISWAPNGSRVIFSAMSRRTGHADLWSVRDDGHGLHQVTDTRGRSEIDPVFSPDGTMIAYSAGQPRPYGFDLWVMHVDGLDPTRLTAKSNRGENARSWQALVPG